MKRTALALTLIIVGVFFVSAAPFAYLNSPTPKSNPEPTSTPESIPVHHFLSVSVNGAGTTNATGTVYYDEGSSVGILAGAGFHHWIKNGTSVGSINPFTVIMNDSWVLEAVFEATTPAPTTPSNSTEIQVSPWGGASDSNVSLVIIDSPTNNTKYSSNSVTLTVHAAAPSWSYMINLYLSANWLPNGKVLFYHFNYRSGPLIFTKGISVTTTLVGIPEGKHTITVTANPNTSIEGSTSVNFTIGS